MTALAADCGVVATPLGTVTGSALHFGQLIAELIGSHADEIAITKNVSEALNLFASSLKWETGQNVVLCPDLEHPNTGHRRAPVRGDRGASR